MMRFKVKKTEAGFVGWDMKENIPVTEPCSTRYYAVNALRQTVGAGIKETFTSSYYERNKEKLKERQREYRRLGKLKQ